MDVIGLKLRLMEQVRRGEEESGVNQQLAEALSESERTKVRLENCLSVLTSQLSTTESALNSSLHTQSDLHDQCQTLSSLLEKSTLECQRLDSLLNTEHTNRKKWEEKARELQICEQAAKEARLLPTIHRILDMKAKGKSRKEQIDYLMMEVIALSGELEREKSEGRGRKTQLEASEGEISRLRYKVKQLKSGIKMPKESLSLLAPEDVEAERLRKVQKLANRPRATLMAPPSFLSNRE